MVDANTARTAITGWGGMVQHAWDSVAQLATGTPSDPAPSPPLAKKPVILVAGTREEAAFYDRLKDKLQADGYDVHVFQLPGLFSPGLGPIDQTARDFGIFVREVQDSTGTDQVDIVAHSQGGLVAREYIKYYGGDATVRNFVGLGVPNHGTKWINDNYVGQLSTASRQMAPGSEFLTNLNTGDETPGNVRYTSIYSADDDIVYPADTAVLDGADNVRVQDQLPDDHSKHNDLPFDPAVQNGIEDALRGERVDLRS